MSDGSTISWTNATWNPTTGCTQVSPGCAHCYAKEITERFGGVFENVILHPERLDKPLHWKKPRRIFVNSMSDLFHEDIPDEYIDKVFRVIADCPQHTFQILTKRIERASLYCGFSGEAFPSVILGPTVENQHWANVRLPYAQQLKDQGWRTMVSYEPALGPVDFGPYIDSIDWLICGAESGGKRRLFNYEWARSALSQARDHGVPFFMKQDSAYRPDVYDTLPDDLKVREFPP